MGSCVSLPAKRGHLRWLSLGAWRAASRSAPARYLGFFDPAGHPSYPSTQLPTEQPPALVRTTRPRGLGQGRAWPASFGGFPDGSNKGLRPSPPLLRARTREEEIRDVTLHRSDPARQIPLGWTVGSRRPERSAPPATTALVPLDPGGSRPAGSGRSRLVRVTLVPQRGAGAAHQRGHRAFPPRGRVRSRWRRPRARRLLLSGLWHRDDLGPAQVAVRGPRYPRHRSDCAADVSSSGSTTQTATGRAGTTACVRARSRALHGPAYVWDFVAFDVDDTSTFRCSPRNRHDPGGHRAGSPGGRCLHRQQQPPRHRTRLHAGRLHRGRTHQRQGRRPGGCHCPDRRTGHILGGSASASTRRPRGSPPPLVSRCAGPGTPSSPRPRRSDTRHLTHMGTSR